MNAFSNALQVGRKVTQYEILALVPGSHPAFRRLQYDEKLDESLGPRLMKFSVVNCLMGTLTADTLSLVCS